MKKKAYILILFLLSIQFNTQSQSKNIDSLYTNYFQKSREIPFLHLNKTSFLKGEEIWFQAYVLEQNSEKLHLETSNLYVSVYDDIGALKEQQLIHLKEGIGRGSIRIDSSFTKKAYYLKASTNWMKNFAEDNSYLQKIVILKNHDEQKEVVDKKNFYDFQLFPEGGHLIANTHNKIGVLIKNGNNEGIQIKKGLIRNDKGKIIKTFSTNKFGFGAATLPIKKNEYFTFEATIDNKTQIIKKTSLVKKIGITLYLEHLKRDNFSVLNVLTNPETLKLIEGKKYRVLLHNTKNFANHYITFNKKYKAYQIFLEKKEIPEGINTITIFNEEDKPVLERIFYNDTSKNISNNLKTDVVSILSDSLKVSIANKNNEKIFLSVSFLPIETKAYKPDNNIISNFLLKPFIKGHIENAAQYFKSNNKKRFLDLDLLLITQGWSKYKWNNIFNNPPSNIYNFEKGIDISLTLNKKISKGQHVEMHFEEKDFILVFPFKNTNRHKLENTYYKKNSLIYFGLKSQNNTFKISPSLAFSNSHLYGNISANQQKKLKTTNVVRSNFSFLTSNSIMLDEVVIKSNLNQKRNYLVNSTFTPYNPYLYNRGVPNPYGIIDFDGKASSWEKYKGSEVIGNPFGAVALGTIGPFTVPTTPIFIDEEWIEFSQVKLPVGFASEKEYYAPKYPSFTNETYINYGAIFWKPSITLDPNSNIEFNVPKNNQQEIRLFLEGISTSGKLISKEKKLDITPKY